MGSANSKKNKDKIRYQHFHYLTLKPKKVGTYRKYIQYFMEQLKKGEVTNFEMNERHYSCVKIKKGNEMQYIFFSPELYETQIKIKERKFERQKKKGILSLREEKYRKFHQIQAGWNLYLISRRHFPLLIILILRVLRGFSFLRVLLMTSLERF